MTRPRSLFLALITAVFALVASSSATPAVDAVSTGLLSPDTQRAIDKAVADILGKTGAPSASIAVVKDGQLAYAHAYGFADAQAHQPATTAMRYSIGSISKQFTAAAVLLLAEEGKLSLDDKVARWLPDATRAGEVTVRQMLSMTSGYQDYWPQDYVMPMMRQPTDAQAIMTGWAHKPLDFEPGAKWQYSNTNYVMAGTMAEKAAGVPLVDFLQQHVFGPLEMKNVFDTDAAPLPDGEPKGYQRFGLGPLRFAPKEGKGWLFAMGELAMTATDLAKWDVSLIDQTILQPASYREMERDAPLNSGVGAKYGLGMGVNVVNGRRVLSHGGEVSGFCAQNNVYPDDRAAIVALTNLDATEAPGQIVTRIANLLFAPSGGEAELAEARKIFAGLQHGKIDRARFTANANAYFTDEALQDLAASLGPLGAPRSFTFATQKQRGGMTMRSYDVQFAKKTLTVITYILPNGEIEQFIVFAS